MGCSSSKSAAFGPPPYTPRQAPAPVTTGNENENVPAASTPAVSIPAEIPKETKPNPSPAAESKPVAPLPAVPTPPPAPTPTPTPVPVPAPTPAASTSTPAKDEDSASSVDDGETPEEIQTRSTAAVKSAPPKKTGMMYKQGHVVKNWKNRYFVLEDGVLTYYDNISMKSKKGHLHLKGVKMVVDKTFIRLNKADKKSHSGHEQLVLEIKYPNEHDEWVDAIVKHIEYFE